MPIDTDKIDETVLALLHLTLHDRARAWKGHDWEALNRLHRKGMIGDPVGKAKSVVLTDQGLAESVCSESYSRGHPEPDVSAAYRRDGKIVRASGSVRSQPLRPASAAPRREPFLQE